MATFYIVATPIGNLKDITLRAIEILSTVKYIACEDSRHTRQLLKYIGSVQKPTLLSYYEQNELSRIPQILNLLANGKSLALVCDAGTPTISDPGFKLVRECIRSGFAVESIPGPSSVITALVISGFPTDKFLFVGYLPKKPGKRKKLLDELFQSFKTLKYIHPTVVIFEAPHRLIRTLTQIQSIFGDIEIVVCRELTKLHEEVRRETVSQSLFHFQKVVPKGEFVILFNLTHSSISQDQHRMYRDQILRPIGGH